MVLIRMRSHILKHDASSTANAVPLPPPGKAKLGLEIIRGGSKTTPYTYLRLSIYKRRSMPKRYSPHIITNRNRATRDFISVQPRFLLASVRFIRRRRFHFLRSKNPTLRGKARLRLVYIKNPAPAAKLPQGRGTIYFHYTFKLYGTARD